MSDTFTFVAPVMPKRRLDPFAARLIAAGLVLAVAISAFGTFVVRAEREADARRAVLEAQQAAGERAQAQQLALEAQAGFAQRDAMSDVPAGVARLLDEQARVAADRALTLAQGALGHAGGLSAAGVSQLTQQDGSLLFVDGPSTAPTIVSVAEAAGVWGAAAMGPSGTCYWVSLAAGGDVRYGRGTPCTGRAALGATGSAW